VCDGQAEENGHHHLTHYIERIAYSIQKQNLQQKKTSVMYVHLKKNPVGKKASTNNFLVYFSTLSVLRYMQHRTDCKGSGSSVSDIIEGLLGFYRFRVFQYETSPAFLNFLTTAAVLLIHP
jgi:hypothetical protein